MFHEDNGGTMPMDLDEDYPCNEMIPTFGINLNDLPKNQAVWVSDNYCCINDDDEPTEKEKPKLGLLGVQKKKKERIPDSLKTDTWNEYIGEEVGRAKCTCCGRRDISQRNFHCGHVDAESKGGKLSVENLRPICSKCNFSMGSKNMFAFKKECGYP